jgi:hypothetical protein
MLVKLTPDQSIFCTLVDNTFQGWPVVQFSPTFPKVARDSMEVKGFSVLHMKTMLHLKCKMVKLLEMLVKLRPHKVIRRRGEICLSDL